MLAWLYPWLGFDRLLVWLWIVCTGTAPGDPMDVDSDEEFWDPLVPMECD